jgi:hypothetical protein
MFFYPRFCKANPFVHIRVLLNSCLFVIKKGGAYDPKSLTFRAKGMNGGTDQGRGAHEDTETRGLGDKREK